MMRLSIFTVVICLMTCAMCSAQTAEEVVARNLEARGGAKKLAEWTSLRMTGQLDLGGGQIATLVTEQKRPGLMRMDMIMGPMRAVRAFDGQTAWQFMPQAGLVKPEPMGEDDAKDAIEEADFGGPLLDYKQKGHTIELLGREAVDGRDCCKLKVTLKNGDERTYWLDAETFLESRVAGSRKTAAGESSFVQTLSDYKQVDGLMFPHTSTVEVKDATQGKAKFVFTVQKIEVNPKFVDEHFKMPTETPTTEPANQK